MANETIREINATVRKLERAAKNIDNRKRKQLLGRAAAPVRTEMRKRTKRGTRQHFRYTGNARITYSPGNLRRSMAVLRKLKRSPDLFVGPDYGGRRGVTAYGGTGQPADGYYYAMAYGSKSAFIAQVRNPAVTASKAKAIAEVKKRFLKLYPAEARKLGINGGI